MRAFDYVVVVFMVIATIFFVQQQQINSSTLKNAEIGVEIERNSIIILTQFDKRITALEEL